MTFAGYLRQQAVNCRYLSRSCTDHAVAEQLRILAAGLAEKASELDTAAALSRKAAHIPRTVIEPFMLSTGDKRGVNLDRGD
jgi:hypothetical protein